MAAVLWKQQCYGSSQHNAVNSWSWEEQAGSKLVPVVVGGSGEKRQLETAKENDRYVLAGRAKLILVLVLLLLPLLLHRFIHHSHHQRSGWLF